MSNTDDPSAIARARRAAPRPPPRATPCRTLHTAGRSGSVPSVKKMVVVIEKVSGAPWVAEPEGKWWDEWDLEQNPFIDACREVGIRTSTLPPTVPRKKILALEAALRRRGADVRIEASTQALNRLDEERAAQE